MTGELEPWQIEGVVRRYRTSHHRIAQMLAMGCSPQKVCRELGKSMRSLTMLMGDPTFSDLIQAYIRKADEKMEEAIDVYTETAVSNMLRAEQQITDHLDEAEEKDELLPINILDKISQGRADRFGYSKHTKVEHSHDFAARLDQAIARSAKVIEPKQIEGTAVEVTARTLPSPAPHGRVEAKSSQITPPSRSFSSVLNPIKKRRVA